MLFILSLRGGTKWTWVVRYLCCRWLWEPTLTENHFFSTWTMLLWCWKLSFLSCCSLSLILCRVGVLEHQCQGEKTHICLTKSTGRQPFFIYFQIHCGHSYLVICHLRCLPTLPICVRLLGCVLAGRGKPTDKAQHFTLLLSFLSARPRFPSEVCLFLCAFALLLRSDWHRQALLEAEKLFCVRVCKVVFCCWAYWLEYQR